MTKATVILGAGASNGVWNGVGNVDLDWQPPLTSGLFGPLRQKAGDPVDRVYEPILNHYRGAQVVQVEISPRLRDEDVSIEVELERYAHAEASYRQRQFRDVPPYFRHLFIEIARNYTSRPGSYINLIGGLYDSGHEVAFLVLNYDSLLEKALALFAPPFAISNMNDYLPHASGRPLITKLHGSVDWGVEIGDPVGTEERWASRMDGFSIAGVDAEASIYQPGEPVAWEWRGPNNKAMYPVLTAPLAGKGMKDAVCPKRHLEAFSEFIADCRKFLVIGTSGRDLDLLEILADDSGAASIVQFVCGSQKSSRETARRFRGAVPAWKGAELQALDLDLGKYLLPQTNDFQYFLSSAG